MTPGRPVRDRRRAVLVLVVPALLWVTGCSRAVDGEATAADSVDAPGSPAELEALIVAEVPSALPRLVDDELQPPAGAKRVQDVAGYSDDPARERDVLEDYGYRQGWERFWGEGSGPITGVFVDQFDDRAGAGAYAEDLARNDAELYRGTLSENPPHLPGGCRLLTVEDPRPETGLSGPAAFVWCGHGQFSVAVTAVADAVDAAEKEVRAILADQLERLPRAEGGVRRAAQGPGAGSW